MHCIDEQGMKHSRAAQQMYDKRQLQQRTEYLRASKSSLSASRSTASCSSPKVLTQLAAPQEAVLTCRKGAMP